MGGFSNGRHEMGFTFSADEIFGMAEQIERNGSKFYRYAADRAKDAALRERLIGLSEWELKHEKRFHGMRAELTAAEREPTVYDPESEGAMYVQALADGHVFNVNEDPTKVLSGQETMPTLLKIALGLEKDSIVFYLGMKKMIGPQAGKDTIDGIIHEEMTHIGMLNRELRGLDKPA